jgi:membrane associated rhomboid family serine protease
MLPLRDARPPRRFPIVTTLILAVCVLAFGYELWVLVQGGEEALNAFLERRGLVAADLVSAWQAGDYASMATLGLVTHILLHGSWLHLFGNLLFLWIFGPNVEDRLGRLTFLALFMAGGLAAAGLQVVVDPTADLPMVGASGAISAVLGAYLVLFPRARIQSLVFLVFFYELIALPSVLVLGFWFVLQLIDGVASLGLTEEVAGGIAFWAHIGGFLAGVLLALPLRFVRRPSPGLGDGVPAALTPDAFIAAPGPVTGLPPTPPAPIAPGPPPPPSRG